MSVMQTVYETLRLCRPLFSEDEEILLGFWVLDRTFLDRLNFWEIMIPLLVRLSNGELSQRVGECAFGKIRDKQYTLSDNVSGDRIGYKVEFSPPPLYLAESPFIINPPGKKSGVARP
jgi:hypothetical protein